MLRKVFGIQKSYQEPLLYDSIAYSSYLNTEIKCIQLYNATEANITHRWNANTFNIANCSFAISYTWIVLQKSSLDKQNISCTSNVIYY